MNYDDILDAIDALDPAAQLQVARYILNRLANAVESDDEPEYEPDAPAYTRAHLPRLLELYQADKIRQGDVVYLAPKKKQEYRSQFAVLSEPNYVRYGNRTLPINDWACEVYRHQAINIYRYVIVDRLQKTLGEIRRDYMGLSEAEDEV